MTVLNNQEKQSLFDLTYCKLKSRWMGHIRVIFWYTASRHPSDARIHQSTIKNLNCIKAVYQIISFIFHNQSIKWENNLHLYTATECVLFIKMNIQSDLKLRERVLYCVIDKLLHLPRMCCYPEYNYIWPDPAKVNGSPNGWVHHFLSVMKDNIY